MLGSRQTRPSGPSARPVFGLPQLNAGMVTSPKPSRAYSCARPLPAWSEHASDPMPQNCALPRTVSENHSHSHSIRAVPCVPIEHTPNELIV